MAKRKVDLDMRLLCERCGYDLSGLGSDGDCPECGRAVAESLPDRRTGTAWQRHGGVRGWWGSLVELVRGNRRMWDVARVERWSGEVLVGVNAAATGLLFVLGVVIDGLIGSIGKHIGKFYGWQGVLLWTGLMLLVVMGVTLGMIWIEQVGIRFFGRRKGLRITKAVAWTIVGHASYGWLVGGVLCGLLLVGPVRWSLPWMDEMVPIFFWRVSGFDIAMIGGYFIGMVVFEVCVYLGMRGMKYANPPGVTD